MTRPDKCVLDEKLSRLIACYKIPTRRLTFDVIMQEAKLEKELQAAGVLTHDLWNQLRPVREGASQ